MQVANPFVFGAERVGADAGAERMPEGGAAWRVVGSTSSRGSSCLDVRLQVLLKTEHRVEPTPICTTSHRHAYWSFAQMVSHHTVDGCNLQPGDLLGTGTLSGPTPDQAAALIEPTEGAKRRLALPGGGQRTWLEDGDTVALAGWCEAPGAVRIGFGTCVGTVLPAQSL